MFTSGHCSDIITIYIIEVNAPCFVMLYIIVFLILFRNIKSRFMSKVDQKRNWVKLKSVQTLLRIACLANRKSYVVIIYANSCEMLTKCEIGSS